MLIGRCWGAAVRFAGNGGSQDSCNSVHTPSFRRPTATDPTQRGHRGFRQGQILWVRSDICMALGCACHGLCHGQALTDLTAAVSTLRHATGARWHGPLFPNPGLVNRGR